MVGSCGLSSNVFKRIQLVCFFLSVFFLSSSYDLFFLYVPINCTEVLSSKKKKLAGRFLFFFSEQDLVITCGFIFGTCFIYGEYRRTLAKKCNILKHN